MRALARSGPVNALIRGPAARGEQVPGNFCLLAYLLSTAHSRSLLFGPASFTMSAVSAEQATPAQTKWFVCGIPEHDLLIFTKDSDIKTKNGHQLKYQGRVQPP